MISADIVADSIYEGGPRLTTMILEYPRFIHSELMTHRVFSRNAASSRAIPLSKTIERATNSPAIPVSWGRNQRGMQASGPLSDAEEQVALAVWRSARDAAVKAATQFQTLGVHKQIANRVLEPFLTIQTLVTATEWSGFLAQRNHPSAQPEMQSLARAIVDAFQKSAPVLRDAGQWHLPFDTRVQRSVARCARVSYMNHYGKESTWDEDLDLYSRLLNAKPPHWSPFEHQAQVPWTDRIRPDLRSNLKGWIQYRKHLECLRR